MRLRVNGNVHFISTVNSFQANSTEPDLMLHITRSTIVYTVSHSASILDAISEIDFVFFLRYFTVIVSELFNF